MLMKPRPFGGNSHFAVSLGSMFVPNNKQKQVLSRKTLLDLPCKPFLVAKMF